MLSAAVSRLTVAPSILNDTIAQIVKLLARIIGADVEVVVKYASDLAAVFADAAQIEQIIMNLGVNARDAMPLGGTLLIETANVDLSEDYCRRHPYAKPGKYVRIRVSDSGTGIDAETQARIFEPFFTTKEVGKGTGLGLSTVYGIVKQHEGHINLESRIGDGTAFEVFLPISERASESENPAIELPLPGGNETILVAEDEEPLRKLAKDFLESLGYTVLLARDGEEAVSMFVDNRARINMLLFDMVMPRVSGSEAYRKIRQLEGADVPLVFMTGYSSEGAASESVGSNELTDGSPAFIIQKPYTMKAIGFKVREVLDNRIATN